MVLGENELPCDKTKFEQCLSTNPVLQKLAEDIIQPKEVNYNQNHRELTAPDRQIRRGSSQ